MKATIYRKEHFNAAHRLYNPNWTEEKNKEVFGKCNNPNFHGHNYELILQLTGEIDPETGYVHDTKKLNLDVEEFKNHNPTVENIAVIIWNILREKIRDEYILKVILYETERNYAEYPHA